MPNPIMKYFESLYLNPKIEKVTKPICEVAKELDEILPDCAEKTAGLRKLLEAKDCFARVALEEVVDDSLTYGKME